MANQFEARMYEAGSGNSRLVVITVVPGKLIIDNEHAVLLDHIEVEVAGHNEDRIQLHDKDSGVTLMCMEHAHDLLDALRVADTNGRLQQSATATKRKVGALPWLKATYWIRITAGVLVGVVVAHFIVDKIIDMAADRIDPSVEKQIGSYLFKDQGKYDRTSENYKRVVRIGNRLTSHLKNCPYTFTYFVDNTSVVNAYACPGGYVVVNKGLIDRAANDDEIAGVMGHEIGHVVHRDSVHEMMHSVGLFCCAGMLVGLSGDYALQIAQALQIGKFLEGQSFSRAQEARCDIFGAGLTAESGYDAEGIAKFFEKMAKSSEASGDNKIMELLSDHPMDSARINAIRDEVRRLKKEHPEWFKRHAAPS